MKIYIFRHGETDLNRQSRLQGWYDEPLNENGRSLAKVTGRALKDLHFDVAYSSPLKRAYETGEIILAENVAGPPKDFIFDERIKEICFGQWERLCIRKDNFEVPDREGFSRFHDDPFNFGAPPGGESIKDVCMRTRAFMEELISNTALSDKTVAVFTHGCAARALLRIVYPEGEPFWHGKTPPNVSLNIIEVTDGVPVLTGDDLIFYDPSLVEDFYMPEKKG